MGGLFISSLNEVIDLHTSRVTVGLRQRLPRPIFYVMFLVSCLAMVVLGYGAGLSQRRSSMPTVAVILAISSVITLIYGLDAPGTGLFQVNQWAMEDLRRTLAEGD